MIILILGVILVLLAFPLVATASLVSYFTGFGATISIAIAIAAKSIFKAGLKTAVTISLFAGIVWLVWGYLY